LFGKGELAILHVNTDKVAELDLSGGHQISQWKNNVLFNGPLQMTAPYFRSVPSSSRNLFTFCVQLNTNWLLPVACRMRCCTMPNSISSICSRCSDFRVLKTTILSMRFMNSGENLRRAASWAVRVILSSSLESMAAAFLDW